MTLTARIFFEHGGKTYEISQAVYGDRVPYVVLPDGTLLKVTSWSKTYPPIPALREETHLFTGQPPERIAQFMNGVLARETALK